MRLDIISIFPEYFAPLDVSLIGKARERGTLDVRVHQLRDWAYDVHRTVDDTPYGGGPGMVMKPEVWGEAIDAVIGASAVPGGARGGGHVQGSDEDEGRDGGEARATPQASAPGSVLPQPVAPGADAPGTVEPGTVEPGTVEPAGVEPGTGASATVASGTPVLPRMIVPTPSGRPFSQELAQELAQEPWLLFACGRYEGIDSRVMEDYSGRLRVDEVSIGDYVLAGGEVAVLVMVEAIGRLLPGVLGNAQSVVDDSFAPGSMENLVEGPVYTKPPVWRGHEVPAVLLSGHHGNVARWRRDEAIRRTVRNRPELAAALDPAKLDKHDRKLLDELSFRVRRKDVAN
ncbi:tRNA (guanine(37)-N(1))-methyltransferase [Nonomuraea fuscirosea]|uniref:tRNA (guanine(37)-N(1))-methyltransferase n=1 Tax=Nonomuraea fuscirosea TaxID=1291556 RepID=UPI0033FEBCFF